MNVLVLMAGDSRRFADSGYQYPKNLVEIAGLPMAEHVIGQFDDLTAAGARLVCVVRKEETDKFHTADVIRLLVPEATVVSVPDLDSGAACTALLAIEQIDLERPLLVFNGDQILAVDLAGVVHGFEERGLDGGVVTFPAVHPRWSYVKTGPDGLVIEAAEKRPISRLATAGTYYFARGGDFMQAVMTMILKDAHVDGRYFVCPAYNQLILEQARIGIHEVGRAAYFSLATPQGVHEYEEHLISERPTDGMS